METLRMAKKQHSDLLERGVTAWNEWREKNSKIRPKLIAANLSGRDSFVIKLIKPPRDLGE
jgi:hypothetical protein